MKKLLLYIMLVAPASAMAQGTWVTPVKQTATQEKTALFEKKQKFDETPYLAGAVPMKDDKVVFEFDIEVPGKDADYIYNKVYGALEQMTNDPNQIDSKSKIAAYNEEEHSIIAMYSEWMVFQKKILVLDRSAFNYRILANCFNGKAHITIERLSYRYDAQDKKEYYVAEDIITDKLMLSKDGSKLKKLNKKFRIKTVDRVNEIKAVLQAEIK